MSNKSRRKEVVVSRDRMLTVYPSLHEIKEKGKPAADIIF